MNEKPIIFNTEMVRAILEGRKTQTRRVIKPQPDAEYSRLEVGNYHPTKIDRNGEMYPGTMIFGAYTEDGEWGWKCPYGQVGDRLWVREAWAADIPGCERGLSYRSDHADPLGDGPSYPMRWRPSIHMPRWASRITLEIVKVRVERVQEITEEDVVREGIPCRIFSEGMALFYYHDGGHCTEALPVFAHLWDTLSPKHPWESNPWVWVVEFRRIQEAR